MISALPSLTALSNQHVALAATHVRARLDDLLCGIEVEQTYENREGQPIEAVYTFPLPLDAALLDLRVRIGGRELQGVVAERKEAEERYEEAVTDGDTAIMLEQAEPGLYTMNVGNLMPGERAEIRVRMAMLVHWHGDSVRFRFPTTLAPRYGAPESAGLKPHQIPEAALLAENSCSFKLRVSGLLAGAAIASPSHALDIRRDGGEVLVAPRRGSLFMDRDIVLSLNSKEPAKPCSAVLRDGDEWLALASFRPEFAPESREKGRAVTVLVDCSGSMAGDSIALARDALRRILDSLDPRDRFNLIAFGSSHKSLFPRLQPAGEAAMVKARALVAGLKANMGGTEIGLALEAAYQRNGWAEDAPDILLLTDGEAWLDEAFYRRATKAGQRIFSVGIGAAVSERTVRELSERTGGACEFVSPNESMAGQIVRHFKRMSLPASRSAEIFWPSDPVHTAPGKLTAVFAGDTVHAFAWFAQQPRGEAILRLNVDGREIEQRVALIAKEGVASDDSPSDELPPDLARLAAHLRLKEIDDEFEAAEIALRYQLVSQHTNYIVVDVRPEGEKASGLPELRKVPHMLAAGWGGTGRCMDIVSCCVVLPSISLQTCASEIQSPQESPKVLFQSGFTPNPDDSLNHTIANLNIDDLLAGILPGIEELIRFGLNKDVADALHDLVAAGYEEKAVIAAFLMSWSNSIFGDELDRQLKRTILRAFKLYSKAELEGRAKQALSSLIDKLKEAKV